VKILFYTTSECPCCFALDSVHFLTVNILKTFQNLECLN